MPETVRIPGQVRKSVGGTLNSILNSKGRTFFTIEYLTSSQKHKAGEVQEFLGDYVDIGRGSKYRINFGDDCKTVHSSNPHAAILRSENGWLIRKLNTNPVILNSRAQIAKEWHLQSGDEIQFSVDGPKIRFFVPASNTVGTLGTVKKMEAAYREIIRPYKQTVIALSVIFIVAIGVLGYITWGISERAKKYEIVTNEQAKKIADLNSENQSIKMQLNNKVDSLKSIVNAFKNIPVVNNPPIDTIPKDVRIAQLLQNLHKDIYYIRALRIEVQYQGRREVATENMWAGTGFLMSDGRFITARHVVEPWLFLSTPDDPMRQINKISANGGTVSILFSAYSTAGSTIQFQNSDFTFDESADQLAVDGDGLLLKVAPLNDGKDWASKQTNLVGSIVFDISLSNNLQAGSTLSILGYPYNIGAENPNAINPQIVFCQVSQSGLSNGMINVGNRGFDKGNSGGPVFFILNNKPIVVGIVSAGIGNSMGFIVPISSPR